MEQYEVTIMKLNTRCESRLNVEVDEGETSEDIVIHAVVSGHVYVGISATGATNEDAMAFLNSIIR